MPRLKNGDFVIMTRSISKVCKSEYGDGVALVVIDSIRPGIGLYNWYITDTCPYITLSDITKNITPNVVKELKKINDPAIKQFLREAITFAISRTGLENHG